MHFKQLSKRALEIKKKYDHQALRIGKKPWNREQLMQGFVGDVGDLMKLVMAKEGIRKIEGVDNKLTHELSDCLWSIIVLADGYKVDLEKSFIKTMDELEKRIDA